MPSAMLVTSDGSMRKELAHMLDSTTKCCAKCKRTKPVTDFHRSTRNGFSSRCKVCRGTAKPKPPITGDKTCRICTQTFPRTREFFWTTKQNRDGFYSTCITCSKVIASQYYHKNKEACNKRSVDWQKRNPEKVKAIKQKTRKKHPDYEGQRIRSKRWRDRHPDRTRFYTAERRAKVKNAEGSHTSADIALQLKSQRGKCWWCGCKLKNGYHLDHIIPLDRGGSNWPNNIVIACSRCNQSRQNKLPHEWSDRLI